VAATATARAASDVFFDTELLRRVDSQPNVGSDC